VNELAISNPTVELPIPYDYHYGANMGHNTISFKIMIIAPDECNEMLQQSIRKFEPFDVTFEPSCTTSDIMKKQRYFITRFKKSKSFIILAEKLFFISF
jgi:hypothetical protein